MKSVINTLNEIRQLYSSRGFRVDNIHRDNKFDKEEIKRSQLPILFHIYGKDEHVGLIERSKRIVKQGNDDSCGPIQIHAKIDG